MSDPQQQSKSDDSLLSIAADFVRVLWRPTAVFRRRQATRTRRVLFVLWIIMTLLAVPFFLTLLMAHPEADDARLVVILTLIIAPYRPRVTATDTTARVDTAIAPRDTAAAPRDTVQSQ